MNLFETETLALSRRNLLRASALLGAGAALSLSPFGRSLAYAAEAAGVEVQWPKVAALLQQYVAGRKVAGMVAALGFGTAEPSYIVRGKEGFDDPDAAGSSSIYRLYSQTKPVTGMAAMMCIDDRKLRLDQPVADFVPEFANMKVAIDPKVSLDARPATTQITIRHLMTHTSGLGYAGVGKNKINDELLRLGVTPAVLSRSTIPGVSPPTKTLAPDAFLKVAATVPLVAEPGTKWSYSMGLDVLGLVIQRASGAKSFADFMHDRLFEPLGMTSSYFQVPASEIGRLTSNYGIVGGFPLPLDPAKNSVYLDPPAFAFGGSGMASTAADYDKFLMMLINGGIVNGKRVMGAAAVQLGMTNLIPDGADTKGTFVEGAGHGAGGRVGLGADAGTFGWAGAAGTMGFVSARAGLRAGAYVQFMPSDALPIQKEFPGAVLADLAAMAGSGPKG